MTMPRRIVHQLEETEALDKPAKPLSKAVARVVSPRIVRNLLSGTNLGHPLHPGLSDVPIGAWSMSMLLDAMGGPDTEAAADLLVGTGVVTAAPTALSGLNDWADTIGPERRVGLVHALANSAALSLYVASLIARRKGDRRKGKALGYAGFGTLVVGAYLGGHLSFVKGVNVNRTAWQEGPADWTPVLADAELADEDHRTVDADGVKILLYRSAGRVFALAETCSHMGGPLGEGTIEDGCVTCPWHGSIFRFADAKIIHGPASTPQPRYETRIMDGRIEVRVPPPGRHAEEPAGTHHRRIPVRT